MSDRDPHSLAGILSRARFPDGSELETSEARAILHIGFSDDDRAALRDLLARNRSGEISDDEKEHLNNLLSISYFFDILHSKARLALKRTGESGTAA